MKNNKNKRVTIKDIAKHTGFSIATVSRVLNDSGVFYSQDTYRKIKKAIEELDYHPDAIARGLKTRKTNNIAFLEPWTSEFFSEVFLGIQDAANEAGYSVAIFSSNYDAKQEERNIKTILSNRLDGVIISSAIIDEKNIKNLFSRNIPVVIIEKFIDIEGIKIPTISIKNLEISNYAVSYLIELGHKKIGFMGEPLEIGKISSRFRGYKKALEEKGITFDQDLVFVDDSLRGEDYSNSFEYIVENIRDITRCSALFITSDKIAIVAIKALKRAGISVPEDISIIGFDGLEVSKYITPGLTTIVQPRYEMGSQAMKMLIKLINGEKVVNTELKAEFVIGESTAPFDRRKKRY